jgi:hypothetical protein
MGRAVFHFLLIAAAFLPAGGQEPGGAIVGTVIDPKGSAIAKAKVTATNAETKSKVTASTASDGSYAIRNLPAGSYDVVIEARGFNQSPQRVQVGAGNGMRLDIQLEYNDSAVAKQEAKLLLDALDKTYSDGDKERHEENGIHACRPGHAMMDVDLTSDTLFCYHISNDVSSEESLVDESTEREGMRACPASWYVRGIRDSQQHKGTFKITFTHAIVLLCSKRPDVTLYRETKFSGGCVGDWSAFADLEKYPDRHGPSDYWPPTIMTGITTGKDAGYDALFCVTTQPIPRGQVDFYHICGDCHGTDGSAATKETRGFRKITSRPLGSAEVQAMTDAELQKIFTARHHGDYRVRMKLSTAQIQDLVSFIRTLKH